MRRYKTDNSCKGSLDFVLRAHSYYVIKKYYILIKQFSSKRYLNKTKFFPILVTILLSLSMISVAKGSDILPNQFSKAHFEGSTNSTISGTFGKDYRLVTPKNSNKWVVNITISSEDSSENVQVRIVEVVGNYPYNFDQQTNPVASNLGKVNLVTNLDPTKTYEVWLRDAYARKFEGTISEKWSGTPCGVIIDSSKVSSPRSNINSTQTIGYHVIWSDDKSNVVGANVSINDVKCITGNDGWVKLNVSSKNVGKINYSIKSPELTYQKSIPDVSIIWDKVIVNIVDKQRINVGRNNISWTGNYAYDNEVFSGSLVYNDTLSKNDVGEYCYRVVSINDPKYRVTLFSAKDFKVIYDRINVTLRISDDRIDVGAKANVTWTAFYEYDKIPCQGKVNLQILNSWTSTPTPAGKTTYSVWSIEDTKYGLTVFTPSQVDCVYDRVKITNSSVTLKSVEVKQPVTVWYKAVYEYDGEAFDGSKGNLSVNNETLAWSSANQRWEKQFVSNDPQTLSLKITGVKDNQYGLTAFIDSTNPISVQWVQQEIPGYPLLSIACGIFLIFFLKKPSIH